jgi:hypothetical protein
MWVVGSTTHIVAFVKQVSRRGGGEGVAMFCPGSRIARTEIEDQMAGPAKRISTMLRSRLGLGEPNRR